ncbi:MAG: DEAD/DEAH box helicase, partial [Myxococcota bacterium]|nr:DEAD/DEAH box helicase [Myxococcota bacterium]
ETFRSANQIIVRVDAAEGLIICVHHYGPVTVRAFDPPQVCLVKDSQTVVLAIRDLQSEADAERGIISIFSEYLTGQCNFADASREVQARWPHVEIEEASHGNASKVADSVTDRIELVPHTAVEAGHETFSFECVFRAGGRQVTTKAVLAAYEAGAHVMQLKRGTSVALPMDWLNRYGAPARCLLALHKTHKGQIPNRYLVICPAEFLNAETRQMMMPLQDDSVDVPRGFAGQLRDYQAAGFNWMFRLHRAGLGGVLADDMGLGKTVQAIAFLLSLTDATDLRCLIVAPRSVFRNWASEIEKFAPQLTVETYYGSERRLSAARHVTLTTYGVVLQDIDLLASTGWSSIILDEAQQFKNPTSRIARKLRRLRATSRFALTGTPFENRLDELWSIFEVILPGYLGRRASFRKKYTSLASGIGRQHARYELARLRLYIDPFILRRLKSKVAQELPERSIQDVHLTLSDEHLRFYKDVESRYRRSVGVRLKKLGVRRARFTILEALMRLRQIATAPGLVAGGEGIESTKIQHLLVLAGQLAARGHRTLIFSQWPSALRQVEAALQAYGHDNLYLDGATKDRARLCEKWNRDGTPAFFLLSLKAGGVGLNLTGADVVIHLDPWWNPAVENQAMDRAYRIGQTRHVHVFRFIAENTVESRVVKTQTKKADLFNALFGDEREYRETVTFAELGQDMLTGAADDSSTQGMNSEIELDKPLRGAAPISVPSDELPHVLHEHLALTGKLTTPLVAMLLGCSSHVARKRLGQWVKAGLLIRRGRRQNTRYLVPK